MEKLREEIDEVDSRLAKLIRERAMIAREIGEVKNELGMGVEDVEREKEVLDKAGGLDEIFKCIIEHCKNEERK